MALTNEEIKELGDILVWAMEELAECADPGLPEEFCNNACRAKQLICGEYPASNACARITTLTNNKCGGCSS